MKKSSKISIVISSIVLLFALALVLLVIFFNNYTYGESYKKIVASADQVNDYQNEILSDLSLLETTPIFKPITFSSDATPYLEKFVPWNRQSTVSETSFTISQEQLDRHSQINSKEDLEKLFSDSDLIKVDTSWLDEIMKYDHLTISAYPGVKEKLDKMVNADSLGRINLYAELPAPQFKYIAIAGLIRFYQLRQINETEKGFNLIRHLASLFNSVPSVLGPLYAVRLLSLEENLMQLSNFQNWQFIDSKRLIAYKSVSWVWPSLINQIYWGKKFNPEIEKYIKPENGVCAVAGEKALGLGFYDYLEPRFAFESDFSNEINKSRLITKKLFELCHMNDYQFLLTPAKNEEGIFSQEGKTRLEKIPFIRRIVAMQLLAISSPSFTKYYDERAKQK